MVLWVLFHESWKIKFIAYLNRSTITEKWTVGNRQGVLTSCQQQPRAWRSCFVFRKSRVQISALRLTIVSEVFILSYGFVAVSLNYIRLDYNFNIWCYVAKYYQKKHWWPNFWFWSKMKKKLVIIANIFMFITNIIYVRSSFCTQWVYLRSRVVYYDVNNNFPLFGIKISGSGKWRIRSANICVLYTVAATCS